MDPNSREELSALMDGELAAEPTRFLLRRLDHDPELTATWSRWHMIRACLAADPARLSAPRQDTGFAARVAGALQVETAAAGRPRAWARYVGGGAIAASVAVAALMLNAPSPAPERGASLARHSTPAANAAAPVSLAQSAPAAGRTPPPWSLSRQPTVLGAQPASANVIYGTGLMQPDYLRRATFARDVALSWTPSLQGGQGGAQATVVLLPQSPRSSGAAASH